MQVPWHPGTWNGGLDLWRTVYPYYIPLLWPPSIHTPLFTYTEHTNPLPKEANLKSAPVMHPAWGMGSLCGQSSASDPRMASYGLQPVQ